MVMDEWAARWKVPKGAILDLRRMICVAATMADGIDGHRSESAIQSLVRLEAAEKGIYLWRNNVGALHTDKGDFVRYGLANDSPTINRIIKSADLIGIRPLRITQDMVGCTIGQFVSREVKAASWKYSNTDRERAQLAWAQLILSLGGDAAITNQKGTL